VRDMTLLRMDVERTRATAELQQARAELAALQQPGPAAGAPAVAAAAAPGLDGAAVQLVPLQQQRATQAAEGGGGYDDHDDDCQEGVRRGTPQVRQLGGGWGRARKMGCRSLHGSDSGRVGPK
jgi:hypothetical protein